MARFEGWKCTTHSFMARTGEDVTEKGMEQRMLQHSAMHLDEVCKWEKVITQLLCPNCAHDLTQQGIDFGWELFNSHEFNEAIQSRLEDAFDITHA